MSATPEILKAEADSTIASQFRPGVASNLPLKTDNDHEKFDVVFLENALFQKLFGTYSTGSSDPTWGGTPNLERFPYLAHVKKAGVDPRPGGNVPVDDN